MKSADSGDQMGSQGMTVRVDDQLDLFRYNPTQEDLNGMAGKWQEQYDDLGGVKYLTAPRWNNGQGMWTCLANVCGMLCTVEVFITVPETV